MYFWTYKIYINEIKRNILLEMFCNACITHGNGRGIYGVGHFLYMIKKLRGSCLRNFFFYQPVQHNICIA